jgi:hypothetical protein
VDAEDGSWRRRDLEARQGDAGMEDEDRLRLMSSWNRRIVCALRVT